MNMLVPSDESGAGPPAQDTSAKGKKNGGAWRRVLRCDGASDGNRIIGSKETVMEQARSSTMVKICKDGSMTRCVTSRPNTFPIKMLAKGRSVSHNDNLLCDKDCVTKTWEGSYDLLDHLWSECGDPEITNSWDYVFYWACNNHDGLHVSGQPSQACGWYGWGQNASMDRVDVYIDLPGKTPKKKAKAGNATNATNATDEEESGTTSTATTSKLLLVCVAMFAVMRQAIQ